MEGRASRMELLPHSYSSSCKTNQDKMHRLGSNMFLTRVYSHSCRAEPEWSGPQSGRPLGRTGARSIFPLPLLPNTFRFAAGSQQWCGSSSGQKTACLAPHHLEEWTRVKTNTHRLLWGICNTVLLSCRFITTECMFEKIKIFFVRGRI